jgi:hypothetical protein
MTELHVISKKKVIRNICPYCNNPFKFTVDFDLSSKNGGITSTLIRPHENCRNFLIFIDTNGNMRGSQCIDLEFGKELENTKDIEQDYSKYVKLFEDQENISDFYYILQIKNRNLSNKGVITSKKVKYHQLVRTSLFRQWIKTVFKSENNFSFMLHESLLIICVNLYDMVIFTLGIEIDNFDPDLNLNDIPSMIKYVKEKAVSLGEKILS